MGTRDTGRGPGPAPRPRGRPAAASGAACPPAQQRVPPSSTHHLAPLALLRQGQCPEVLLQLQGPGGRGGDLPQEGVHPQNRGPQQGQQHFSSQAGLTCPEELKFPPPDLEHSSSPSPP